MREIGVRLDELMSRQFQAEEEMNKEGVRFMKMLDEKYMASNKEIKALEKKMQEDRMLIEGRLRDWKR